MDWVVSFVKGLLMVVLPIAAFAVGIMSVNWPDDTLRKAVIAKNWSSTSADTEDKKPVDAEDAKDSENSEDDVTPGNQPKPDPKVGDGG